MSDKKKGFDANKAIDQIKADRNLTVTAAGAVALIVGLFLPWYSINSIINVSYSPGLNSTGFLLIIAAIVAVGASLNVMNMDKKTMAITSVGASVVATLLMLNDWPSSGLGGTLSVGIGYWLALAGAIAMTVGAIMHMQAEKSSK